MRIDWHVETMRITVFPSDIASVSVPTLWDSVMDHEPDEIHFQRDKIDAREIKYGNGRLVLAKQTDRIDWHYLSIRDVNTEDIQLPVIGKLEEELDTFTEWANPWFDSSDMLLIDRLAFGAVLLNRVNTVEEGNAVLGRLLPNMNFHDARDFSYQVNRRRISEVDPDVKINRLSKWNVYSARLVTMTPNVMQSPQVGDLSIASRLELDINTFQERTETLSPQKLSKMFKELVKLGLEISERGDIV